MQNTFSNKLMRSPIMADDGECCTPAGALVNIDVELTLQLDVCLAPLLELSSASTSFDQPFRVVTPESVSRRRRLPGLPYHLKALNIKLLCRALILSELGGGVCLAAIDRCLRRTKKNSKNQTN